MLHLRALRAARKLFALSPAEWRDYFRAQAAIVGAHRTLRDVRIGDLAARSAPADVPEPSRPAARPVPNRAWELALALERAAKFGLLRPQCLARSLALQRLLDADGITESVIRVGVRRGENELLAHAWVELHGRVLGDREEYTRRFVRLKDLDVRGER